MKMDARFVSIVGLIGACLTVCPQSGRAEDPGVGLGRYTLKAGPIILTNNVEDASGIAFCPESQTLFVVLNGRTSLVEITPSGSVVRVIALAGFNDTEDVAWVGGRTFAVVEERRRNLVVFDLEPGQKSVDYAQTRKALVEPTPFENVGLEGVTYDAASSRYFIVKEKAPRRVYEVKLQPAPAAPAITQPWNAEDRANGMDDLSGLCYDVQTGHLLVLSDESACVVECTLDGREVARLSLKKGSAGLGSPIAQPEGIALDGQRRLYIVSEPNLVYIFEKAP